MHIHSLQKKELRPNRTYQRECEEFFEIQKLRKWTYWKSLLEVSLRALEGLSSERLHEEDQSGGFGVGVGDGDLHSWSSTMVGKPV